MQSLTVQLYDSLDSEQRDALMVEYDHPFRQYHNRGVWGGGQLLATAGFSRQQLSLATDLMYAGLSEAGRSILPNQFFLKLPDVLATNLLVCGDPYSDQCQALFTGPHLNLRVGGKNTEGVAFGGPQVYGDQRGDAKGGLPGNNYLPQLRIATELFDSLPAELQQQAVLANSPIQTQIELQGRNGEFHGVPVAELDQDARAKVNEFIKQVFLAYPSADVAYAWECLGANGGPDALYLSYYQDSTYPDSSLYQNIRLEGPAAVFYFRGHPHVHAFFNVAMDGDTPLSVGEKLGYNPEVLEGEKLKAVFEQAMQANGKTDFTYYDLDSAVGKLRAGDIRTGDIYNAESWQNEVVYLKVRGKELGGELATQLEQRGTSIDPAREYRIATTDYVANNLLEKSIGVGSKQETGGMLRDQLIDHFSVML